MSANKLLLIKCFLSCILLACAGVCAAGAGAAGVPGAAEGPDLSLGLDLRAGAAHPGSRHCPGWAARHGQRPDLKLYTPEGSSTAAYALGTTWVTGGLGDYMVFEGLEYA